MAENHTVTREELSSALAEVVAHLTKLIQETVAATEAKIWAEVNLRFDGFRREAKRRKNLSQI